MANTGIKVIVTMMTTTRVTVAVREKEKYYSIFRYHKRRPKTRGGGVKTKYVKVFLLIHFS